LTLPPTNGILMYGVWSTVRLLLAVMAPKDGTGREQENGAEREEPKVTVEAVTT